MKLTKLILRVAVVSVVMSLIFIVGGIYEIVKVLVNKDYRQFMYNS